MENGIDFEIGRRVAEGGFGLKSLSRFEHLPQGRVNLSFLVEAAECKYILQRLHPVFGGDGAVVENTALVADVLESAGLNSPKVQKASDGRKWVEDRGVWRLSLWLPGKTAVLRSEHAAREAARILGCFHKALSVKPPTLKKLPPAEYNRESPGRSADWETLIRIHQDDPKYKTAAPVLKNGLYLTQKLPEFNSSTKSIIHGDPKLENVLFSDDGRAVALIDLDTVRKGSLFWELADALRSWTAVLSAGNRKTFDHRIFKAAVPSYKNHGLPMTDREWSRLIPGIRAVTLNLAWRYLKDYFEESYFAWDRRLYPSLSEQNLQRGMDYIRMAEEIKGE